MSTGRPSASIKAPKNAGTDHTGDRTRPHAGQPLDKIQSQYRPVEIAIVDQAGAAMTAVFESIKRVTDILGEISAASTEQRAGVAQVGEAVYSTAPLNVTPALVNAARMWLARLVCCFSSVRPADDALQVLPAAVTAACALGALGAPGDLNVQVVQQRIAGGR